MPDQNQPDPTPDEMKDAARRSQEAGIADESAAYESATEEPAAPNQGDDASA